jgi:hypothetical protein
LLFDHYQDVSDKLMLPLPSALLCSVTKLIVLLVVVVVVVVVQLSSLLLLLLFLGLI